MLVIYLFSCILCVPLCSIERISLAIVHKHSNTHSTHSAAAVHLRIYPVLLCFASVLFSLFVIYCGRFCFSSRPSMMLLFVITWLSARCVVIAGKVVSFSLSPYKQFSIGIDCSFGFCNWLFSVRKRMRKIYHLNMSECMQWGTSDCSGCSAASISINPRKKFTALSFNFNLFSITIVVFSPTYSTLIYTSWKIIVAVLFGWFEWLTVTQSMCAEILLRKIRICTHEIPLSILLHVVRRLWHTKQKKNAKIKRKRWMAEMYEAHFPFT